MKNMSEIRKNIYETDTLWTYMLVIIPNTIYILQYDYCLAGQTIELPDNSIILWRPHAIIAYSVITEFSICKLLLI